MEKITQKICAFDGCERVHYARGWCNPHWQQMNSRGWVGPIRSRRVHEVCTFEGCGRLVERADLCQTHYKQRNRGEELRPIGRKDQPGGVCVLEGCGEVAKLRGYCLRHKYVYKYGMTPERANEVIRDQSCRICGRTDNGKRNFHVDHDHACKEGTCPGCNNCVRGLLCHSCNHGLGNFRDNPALLTAAIQYLEEWNAR